MHDHVSQCEWCHKDFHSFPSRHRRFCSKNCYLKATSGILIKKCLDCGKEFKIYRSEINKNKGAGKFCSRGCYLNHHGGKEIEKECKFCHKIFKIKEHKIIKKGEGKYCSLDCAYNDRLGSNHIRWIERIKINCLQCGKEFEILPTRLKDKKYCSRKCKNETYKDLYKGEKNPHYKGGLILKKCLYCGKEFEIFIGTNEKRKFCSRKCADIHKKETGRMAGENCPRWKGGLSFEPYSIQFNNNLKEKIRMRDNYICQLCGKSQIKNKRKLPIHHIDYDKTNCNNDNLISLCNECHSKTNSNREQWTIFFKQKLAI
jgi:endogenous inhibitor of DNA gyrase (YacG/DUF329 family)